MARAFAELEANPTSTALSHAEWLGLLLDREITERDERRLRARLRFARLRHQAAVEDGDYCGARGLPRAGADGGAWRTSPPRPPRDLPPPLCPGFCPRVAGSTRRRTW